ncbi:MAG: aminopeptidase [Sphaerochaeta sp.]|jgi:aminopeptidase|nr:MAG: aminopeptidase [Sphaerochaeta sp.]
MTEQDIRRYAELIITKGINLQKGKAVLITTGAGTYYFARALGKAAYRLGASYVQILTDDLDLLSSRLEAQSEEEVQFVPAYLKALDYEFISEGWSSIRIDSTEERLDHGPLDPEKNRLASAARRKASEARSRVLMRHQLPWCVCVAPGPLWAKQVLGEDAKPEDLFEVLKPILLLDREDPGTAWDEKHETLQKRMDFINALDFKALHFQSPRTDLTIGFRKEARFVGGAETLPSGKRFFANLPTEEIFSTPDRMQVEGYVTTTRPVEVLNTPTEEVRLVFKEGKVVEHSAKKGQEVLDRFFEIDEGARRIGEVALVDESSPIAQSGLIFHSILLDENASCHLALGEGYPICLEHGSTLSSEEELHEAGCNTSLVHVDFMVGSSDMNVDAILSDGSRVPIIVDGRFSLNH